MTIHNSYNLWNTRSLWPGLLCHQFTRHTPSCWPLHPVTLDCLAEDHIRLFPTSGPLHVLLWVPEMLPPGLWIWRLLAIPQDSRSPSLTIQSAPWDALAEHCFFFLAPSRILELCYSHSSLFVFFLSHLGLSDKIQEAQLNVNFRQTTNIDACSKKIVVYLKFTLTWASCMLIC